MRSAVGTESSTSVPNTSTSSAIWKASFSELRDDGLLGCSVGGRPGFDFDIRIQMGAGSYVCGEESALIESCEGKRGTPRLKPPFPVQEGYLGKPTCVNNVETFAAATRVIEEGAEWFRRMGTPDSAGTRLLSVAGDCDRPGVYEVEWGITLDEVLAMVGAQDARAVQISGPSGECLSVAADGRRRIAYEDIPCNGAVTIFNTTRDLLDCVKDYTRFFVDESCGICVPCRAGTVDLHNKVELVLAGSATQEDLDDAAGWGALVRMTSRCGLGATAANPILTTMEKFPEIYRSRLRTQEQALLALVRSRCCPRRVRQGSDRAGDGRDGMTIRIEIDGVPVSTEENRTLVDVAADAGVYIPTLCYLKDKPCLGTCRVCSVKVNGAVVAACTVRVSDGLKVEVDEPETADIRKALVELLFAEGNHDCPSCEKSGRCTLQAVGYEVDMLVSRFPYRFPQRRARPRLGKNMAGAGSLYLLPTLRGIRPRRSHRPEDLQHQPPRPRVAHRHRYRTCQRHAGRTNPLRRRDLPRRRHHRKTGRLRRPDRPAQIRNRIRPRTSSRHLRRARHTVTNEIASHEMPATPPDPALSAAREDKIKVAMIGLCGCWGCTLSFLDMDERILAALDEGHHSPVLAHRYQENHRAMCDRLHRGGCCE